MRRKEKSNRLLDNQKKDVKLNVSALKKVPVKSRTGEQGKIRRKVGAGEIRSAQYYGTGPSFRRIGHLQGLPGSFQPGKHSQGSRKPLFSKT